jgi:uncharacterized sporulation protein YeaH/YhbH (DUF444 family)
MNIQTDLRRFKDIVRGKIKSELRRFISQGELVTRSNRGNVSIPLPQIELPRFRFGSQNSGGVGQGDGEPGDPVPGQEDGDGEPGQGQGAGQDPGKHELEVELSLEELAEILGQELELPKVEPKGSKQLTAEKDRYSGITRVGPNSLRHFKRTFKEALKRQIATGVYQANNPVIVPVKTDMRFRSWKTVLKQENNALIVYIMDVSGSMGDEQKEIVRIESFWIDTWLRSQYKGMDTRYIIHDASAKEVDQDTFYRTRESGGTLISSAYTLLADMLEKDYPIDDWNVYVFHFSDGDNWSNDDTKLCMSILDTKVLPRVNLFCYGQVESRYGSGQFFKDLAEVYTLTHEKVTLSKIENREAIVRSIKDFLGKGK